MSRLAAAVTPVCRCTTSSSAQPMLTHHPGSPPCCTSHLDVEAAGGHRQVALHHLSQRCADLLVLLAADGSCSERRGA